MKPLVIAAVMAAVASPVLAPSALAQSGCVGRVLLPPVESARAERVMASPGHVERTYVAARLARTSHRVLVRPARQEQMRWPALYRVERRVVSEPGSVRWTREPDHYADLTEQVLVTPGHYVWEQRRGPLVSAAPQPGQTLVTPTGLVMCRVWCPARYALATRRVRVQQGRAFATRTTVQREIARRVLIRPAGSAMRRLPAEYRWVSTSRVIAPARWDTRRIPAQYGWRQVREVHDGGADYAPVVCGGPLSRPAMARMQGSLAARGYDPGSTDGVGRPETYEALRRFQVDHRMAAGQVTVESARSLGVIP